MKLIVRIWLTLFVIFLSGCSASVDDYAHKTPRFELFEYFNGRVTAWGMVQDYTGMQNRRFTVAIQGHVDGDVLVLDESFIYDDGERQTRVWTITRKADGRYIGVADDIIGQAEGKTKGNALNWIYDMDVVVDGDPIRLRFDDWLYRQDDKHLFNITTLKKWGITVGQVTLFFEKQ